MFFHERKNPRLRRYNYASENFYFVTICTAEKKCIFGKPGQLNDCGIIAHNCAEHISVYYPHVVVDKFVIMPNHVHMILRLTAENKSDLSRIIGQYKMAVTRQIRKRANVIPVWQRSFYDHVIRDEKGYLKIWEYIENNPYKWELDCFYSVQEE